MDRLNIFNPYKDKGDEHEDVLTRNFLILLKNISSVQVAFIEMIRDKMKTVEIESLGLGELEITEIRTQVHSNTFLSNLQGYRAVSVVISDDKYDGAHVVKKSNRRAIYDGVVQCDPAWIFVIENKPFVGNIWEGQFDPNHSDVTNNVLIEELCCLSWREIIHVLNNLIEHNMVDCLERVLIEDFLMYINEEYSWFNPYDRFGI